MAIQLQWDLTVGSGSHLTLVPWAVLKFGNGQKFNVIGGTLDARGRSHIPSFSHRTKMTRHRGTPMRTAMPAYRSRANGKASVSTAGRVPVLWIMWRSAAPAATLDPSAAGSAMGSWLAIPRPTAKNTLVRNGASIGIAVTGSANPILNSVTAQNQGGEAFLARDRCGALRNQALGSG